MGSANTSKCLYFDYAAATPMDPKVVAVMKPYFSDKFYNPSATYLAARQVSEDLQAARTGAAKWLGAKPTEIVFTAGGTEANNLAIQGVMQAYPDGNLVVSAIEHDSILKPAQNYDHKLIKVSTDGSLDLDDLQIKIDDKTVLVSVMYANNEIGTIQPIAEIAQIITALKQKRQKQGNKTPLYFHTDACQAAAYLDLQVHRLGVDLMTLNGGKIYGPKQSGLLFIKTSLKLKPQILGGGQEYGLRNGTENVAGIIGLAKALDLVQNQRRSESRRLQGLQQIFFDLLTKSITGLTINGSTKKRLPNNVHITIEGTDNEQVMMRLDEQGVICGVGSACSASHEEPSHVLKAIGLSDNSARSSLRFTMGQQTTEQDVRTAVKCLQNCL